MEIQCPSCKKTNSDSASCTRCGCELRVLQELLQAAEREIALGKNELRGGKPVIALNHAVRSWQLKNSPEAAKLAFLATICERRFEEALKWYSRVSKTCILLFIVIVLSGCATYKIPTLQRPIWDDTTTILKGIEGKAQDLSVRQIRNALISGSSGLTTFRSDVEMVLVTPDVKGPVRCTGLILYQSPKSLRAVGSRFATTVFDMTSDGDKFRLYVPREKNVYTGNCNAFHRIDALGITIFPGDMVRLFNYRDVLESGNSILEIWPAFWLLHILETGGNDAKLKGNLFVDRVHGEVFRCEIFNAGGSVRFQAVFTNYTEYNGCRIPQKIDVRWPAYNTSLHMTFSNVIVNGHLDPKVFNLTIPKIAQTVVLD